MPPDASRRDPAARTAILRAALDLCRERGFDKLTVEGVARRAGVGKQTVYRWWPSLPAVLLEAMGDVAAGSDAFPSSGDVVADLRGQMHEVAELMSSPQIAPYTGLIGAAQTDPELRRAIFARLVAPRVQRCRERLGRAQADGEIRLEVDLQAVVEVLYAPLYYRLLLTGEATTAAHVDTVVDLVFAGIAPHAMAAPG